jgi:Fe-S oxidoreductase
MDIPIMSDRQARGEVPEVLFWVGCAGSFDPRARRVTKALAAILDHAGVSYAVLGREEMCTGDPVRRAGNEFLFQMMAHQNIRVLDGYGVKRIVTACPHCFNTLRNEYPELGGRYDVVHHAEFLQRLLDEGRIRLREGGPFRGRKVTYHDSCYLGRANGVYDAPRRVLEALDASLAEMGRCRSRGLCCGAGGAQMFKEEEKGARRVNHERTDEVLATGASVVAAACPFCNTMLTDGVAAATGPDAATAPEVLDIAEMIAASLAEAWP